MQLHIYFIQINTDITRKEDSRIDVRASPLDTEARLTNTSIVSACLEEEERKGQTRLSFSLSRVHYYF